MGTTDEEPKVDLSRIKHNNLDSDLGRSARDAMTIGAQLGRVVGGKQASSEKVAKGEQSLIKAFPGTGNRSFRAIAREAYLKEVDPEPSEDNGSK